MNAKVFSFKAEGILLVPVNDSLKLSQSFDRKKLTEELKELFKTDGYTIDEASLSYKIKDDQLFIEGLAVENEEPKTVGFRFGK
jgi:hypothetical protein